MHNLLIISFSEIARDPRVMRQIRLLEHRYVVTVLGYGSRPDAAVDFISLNPPKRSFFRRALNLFKLLLGCFEQYYWQQPQVKEAKQCLIGRTFHLVLANDISALPLGLAQQAPVLFDAHEYSPREFDEKWWWRCLFGRYQTALCRRYLPLVQSMLTVCDGIAVEYTKHFGVQAKVVHSAPTFQPLLPSVVNEQKIRLIHHGAAIRARHLEKMIEMVNYLDKRFRLDLMLVPTDAAYLNELKALSAESGRIRFIPPVPLESICNALNAYDVGVYILPPVNFNHEFALPNKFFEFIQARLAIAIGPSLEMARLVRTHACGVVATSFEPQALAKLLNEQTSEDFMKMKNAASRAAHALSFEQDAEILLGEVEKLVAFACFSQRGNE